MFYCIIVFPTKCYLLHWSATRNYIEKERRTHLRTLLTRSYRSLPSLAQNYVNYWNSLLAHVWWDMGWPWSIMVLAKTSWKVYHFSKCSNWCPCRLPEFFLLFRIHLNHPFIIRKTNKCILSLFGLIDCW